MQQTIFDILYEQYKIKKPIKLIELFAGYGSQYLALKYLGANVEHHKICEWATKSIQAYNDLHIQDYNDYSQGLSNEEVIDCLVKMGVSINYNDPATKEQIKRQKYRTIYNNIIATNNLVNIQNAKGEDFEIKDKETFTYLLTYSFPCQDLSLAGLRKGMGDTSTRSGMLWEVERILKELKKLDELPQILLMENVPQVHGQENVADFNKWQYELEKMGYKNYFQDLIATDYGIPQTRNRTFMLSILGDYSYTFPKPIPLKLKLKDLLEDEVDEKYFLSEKMLNCFINPSDSGKKFGRDKQFLRNLGNDEIAQTITTRAGNRATDNFIKIKNATNTTMGRENNDVVVNRFYKQAFETLNNNEVKDGDIIDAYNKKIINNGNSPTVTTRPDGFKTAILPIQDSRIRKLTPKECFRLMGVKDEDFEKIAKNQSDSSLYHLAGDSIVVNVLMAIFKNLI